MSAQRLSAGARARTIAPMRQLLPLLALLAAWPAAAAPGRTRLALLDTRGEAAAAQAGLNPVLAAEAGRREALQLLARPELAAVAGAEVEPAFLACGSGACLSETGLALDLDLVAVPSLVQAGGTFVVSVALFDVRAARPRAFATRTVDDERALLEAGRAALAQVLDEAADPKPRRAGVRSLAVLGTRGAGGAGLDAIVAGEVAVRAQYELWPASLSDAQLPTSARDAPTCHRDDEACLLAQGELRGVELVVASEVTAGEGGYTFGVAMYDRATRSIVARASQTVPTAAALPAAARLAAKEAFFDQRAADALRPAMAAAPVRMEPYGTGYGHALTWTGAALAVVGVGAYLYASNMELATDEFDRPDPAEVDRQALIGGGGQGLFVGGLAIAATGAVWLLTYEDDEVRP